jgi:cytochrome P450
MSSLCVAYEVRTGNSCSIAIGGGARVCLGEQFAWMDEVLVIAVLAARWHLGMAPGQRGETKPQITLRPKYPMKVVVEQRDMT